MKSWIGNIALAGLLLALAGSGCRRAPGGEGKENQDKEPPPVLVEVAPLTRGPIQEVISSTARLEAEADVRVIARTSNRVTELLVEEGVLVERDQVLLRMQDDIQTSAVAKAEARLEKTRVEFGRVEALYQQELISEQAYTDTKFELRQLELALEDARRELEFTRVRAPIAGTITQRLVKTGDLVNLGQHLFSIVDFGSQVALVHVPDKQLPSLSPDQQVRVKPTALGGRVFEGYVARVSPVVDAQTGLVKVTVAFHDVGPLRPGMYVEVELVTAVHEDALLIPKRALVLDQDLRFAYRLKDDRTVERLPVEVRLSDELHVEPVGGFAEGDQVVVAGQTGLKNGAKVRLPGDPDPEEEKEKDAAKEQDGARGQPDADPKPEAGPEEATDGTDANAGSEAAQ